MLTRRLFLSALALTIAMPASLLAAPVDSDAARRKINAIRKKHGLAELETSQLLKVAAQDQADRMAKKGKVSHHAGWGKSFYTRMSKLGLRVRAAENIGAGYGSLDRVIEGWMQSAEHRKNMLDPAFRHFGIARALPGRKSPYGDYWAIVFSE